MSNQELLASCVDFAQRLIQTPSMPGEEGAIARLIRDEMEQLAFDAVRIDEMGNVHGYLHGRERNLPALVLNAHLDHVDPGDPALWPVPPYAGAIVDGHIVGRGACDIKGPLAVQVYSMAGLVQAGERPRRDVVFTGVVQEEVGGDGAVFWVENLDYDVALVVLAEPSSNNLSLGHRGIWSVWVTFHGRSVHASVPKKGDNPNYALASFLQKLETAQVELSAHPLLGKTTVAPTVVEVDTTSKNVTPAWTRVLLDFRTATESSKSLKTFIRLVAGDLPHTISAAYENFPADDSDATIMGYDTPADSELVQRVQAALARGMGREPALTSYEFATDGRHFVPYGLPIVGYAPGDEKEAHTAGERIPIDTMGESLRGYMQLLREF